VRAFLDLRLHPGGAVGEPLVPVDDCTHPDELVLVERAPYAAGTAAAGGEEERREEDGDADPARYRRAPRC
jgi:hypothetical protein